MAEQIPEGHRRNALGHLVPESLIKPIDKLRDDLVHQLVQLARQQREALAAFKAVAMSQVADFVDLSAAEYGVKFGGTKGNVCLTSYDGRYKVERAVGDHRIFDERIQAAKTLLDACIERWCSEGAHPHIRTLVEHAFRVNKQGHIDVNEVLGLRQLAIDDQDWKSAMDAIADSIQVTGTSSYLRISERQEDGRYKLLPLDIAKL